MTVATQPKLPYEHHEEQGSGWPLWRRQVAAILGIELRKTAFGRRSIPVYVLAMLPLLVLAFMALVRDGFGEPIMGNIGQARQYFSYIYQALILGMVVFFGSAGIFTNLFRGEVLDRSLHYYFLSPLRREVLVVAKFLAGLLVTVGVFGATTLIGFLLVYLPFGIGPAVDDLTGGPGLSQLMQYLGITTLGCIGYGSLFLMLGLVFRNPILPIFALLLWEFLHFLLPPALKKLSVIHYLKGLLPIPLSEGPLAVVTEPPPAWLSVIGLLALAAVALVVASVLLRRMEIRYSDD